MTSLLERKLLVVTGKGGVGKTTIAAAVGLSAAHSGRRVIVVELGEQSRLAALFGVASTPVGVETRLQERLASISIDPDRALLEWLQSLGGRVPGRVLASSGTFQYFAAAAPGAKELVSMVKIWELTQGEHRRKRAATYDLVVLDAPATGHALGMLNSPRTFGAIARVGPIARQTQLVRELLEDPARSGYLAVAQGTELAVAETLELQVGLHQALGRTLDAVIVNGSLPRRFSSAELLQISRLSDDATPANTAVKRSALLAATAVHDRARLQHNQIARLRRAGLPVQTVPFVFTTELDLDSIQRISQRLSRSL